MSLSNEQTQIHELALNLAKRHREVEWKLIEVLQKVERFKIHRNLEMRSLFQYATEILKLDEAIAYALITVARKSTEIPELNASMAENKLSIFKASRIVAGLNQANALEVIAFAETHSKREIENEMARRNPKTRSRDNLKVLSEEWIEIKTSISPATLKKLKRVVSLLAQKGKESGLDRVLDEAMDAYLTKHDPVQKAERALKKQLCPGRDKQKTKISIIKTPNRVPLTAAQKNAVFARDGGRCTHENAKNHRCNEDKWLHVHHVIPVSRGGTNDPENLTTLCSFHHDLIHQLSFAIDGQVNWLRSPIRGYG